MWHLQHEENQLAFEDLVRRWQKPIRHLCARITGDAHLAEDLTQEAFVRVFLHRHRFRGGTKFSTWLWRISLNLCYTSLRRSKSHQERTRQVNADTPDMLGTYGDPDGETIRNDEAEIVQQALQTLPEQLRIAITLRYCDGMKLRAVAQKLNIPETTAASRCALGLARLARRLRRELGITP